MALDFELDLEKGETIEQADAGGSKRPGMYPAILHDVSENRNNPDTTDFIFQVTAGVCKGQRFFFYLPGWRHHTEESKRKMAYDRMKTIAVRTGMATKEDFERGKIKGTWVDAIGNKCWIEVTDQKQDDGNFQAKISYCGIYPYGHHDLPKLVAQHKTPEEVIAVDSELVALIARLKEEEAAEKAAGASGRKPRGGRKAAAGGDGASESGKPSAGAGGANNEYADVM